jgi:hypothetical protein
MQVRSVFALAVAAALLAPVSMSLQAQGAPAPATPAPVLKKSAPPLRGQAELGFVQTAKLDGNTIVTTFQIKNMSATNAIVGLQISEFWYDKAGNPLQGTGDRQRLRAPLQPLEIRNGDLEVAEGHRHDDPAVQVRAEQRDGEARQAEGH